MVNCYREKHKIEAVRWGFGCVKSWIERGSVARHWQTKEFHFSSQFQSNFQVRGAEPEICVVVWFWWNYALKFVMHMKEIWGLWVGCCCALSFGLSAWRKGIYTLHMRGWCETLDLGNFMESILCLCVVAICVNWFGMIEFCLVCLVVWIGQGWVNRVRDQCRSLHFPLKRAWLA